MPDDIAAILQAPALVERIGNTPLLPIAGLDVPASVEVFAKAEWLNPGGSVKDRAAWAMVRDAERSGRLAPGGTILDATSGNTGIALAWIGAVRGYRVRLCVPANASAERRRLLAALGAELVLTDRLSGTDAAIVEARRIAAADPTVFYADQYANPANWRAHYEGTAEEVWAQTEGRVTHFVATIGTSGTLVGVARRLRELRPAVEVTAVQPDGPLHVLEGVKHLASCMVPSIYDATSHDRMEEVSSEEAIDMVMRQARHGLMVGWSSGAALVAAARVARRVERGVVVTVLPDGASRYLGDPLWDEARPPRPGGGDAR